MRRKRFIKRGVSFEPGAAAIAVLFMLVAFVGGCGGEQASSSSVDEQDGSTQGGAGSAKTEPAEETVASVGEPVTVGDVQWTVTKAEWSDILASDKFGSEEGSFVLLDVDFANNSNQDIRLATPLLSLVDSEGNEFEPDINVNFFHVYGDENMFVGKVEPGSTKQGRIIFSVDPDSPDSSGFKFRAGEGKFGSTVTRDIALGKMSRAY